MTEVSYAIYLFDTQILHYHGSVRARQQRQLLGVGIPSRRAHLCVRFERFGSLQLSDRQSTD